MQPHDRFHAGFLIQLLSFVPPTYLHACLLIEATDGPGRYLAAGLLASRRISDPGGSEREENLARVNSALESRMRDMVKEFDEEKTLLAAKVDQLVEQLKAENARLASEKERVEGEKQRLYYDYKKLLRRGSSKSTRGSATSARSAPVQGSPRLAHPRSSSSSAPAEVMPSLDERRPSLFTASDDSDEAATTRAAPAGEEGGAN